MEVLERISVAERGTVKKYERLEDDPEFIKNHPLNADNMTAEEIMEHIMRGVRDYEEGRYMNMEELERRFKEKYGI